MSNFLAIGAVTALLRDHLNEGLVKRQVVATLEPDHVGALAPDLIELDTNGKPKLNLFLHQVSPNTGWHNVGLPSFDGRGMQVGNPPLALDLHYLLTAQGAKNFQAEVLLGCAMQMLHETPVLTRDTIREAQRRWASSNDALLKALATAELSDQTEQIKITLESMNPEEMSRLWTAFQAHYRPTAAYRVTVVLIETEHARRNVLPVLTLGPADRGVFSQPDLTPPTPTLIAVTPPNKQVSAQLEDDLTLEGHRLDGITLMDEAADATVNSKIFVRFFDPRRQRALEAEPQAGNTANQMTVRLRDASEPGAPNTAPEKCWAAGFYSVSVLFRRPAGSPDETSDRTTNEVPLSLAPTILRPIKVQRNTKNDVTFIVKCKPEVRWDQRASLLVGSIEIPAKDDAIKDAAEAVAKAAEDEVKNNPAADKDTVSQKARDKAEEIKDEANSSQEEKDAAEAVAKAAEDEVKNNPNPTPNSVRDAARRQAERTDTLTFGPKSIDKGDYFVRLRVDNVESLLIDRASTPPAFDQRQKVTIA